MGLVTKRIEESRRPDAPPSAPKLHDDLKLLIHTLQLRAQVSFCNATASSQHVIFSV